MTYQEFKTQLSLINCYDISIQENVSDGKILIIVCETECQSDILFDFIHKNKFDIRGFAKSDNDLYTLVLYFNYLKDQLICRTTKTIEEYPPILWLESGLIKFITTGVFAGFNIEGMPIYSYKRLSSLLDNVHKN